MKRKRCFLIAINSLLLGGCAYLYAHNQIQNVFDELYDGHQDACPFRLTAASYHSFGSQPIPDSLRHMADDEIIEYLETDLLNEGE